MPDPLGLMRRRKNYWKARCHACEDGMADSIILPGYHRWSPMVERWRSLVWYYMQRYDKAQPKDLDILLGIMEKESQGLPLAVCHVEWIGDPPPGYDGTPATRASGLFQQVPAYWQARAKAAGFEGRSIFDVDANVGVAVWLLYDGWHPDTAPNWRHWSAAHVGRIGSYEWALSNLKSP